MCWLAIGFLLIICMLLLGRSYEDIIYSEGLKEAVLEGRITDKQYKESSYGGYWQVTLKNVKVLREDREKECKILTEEYGEEDFWKIESDSGNKQGKVEALEGKYLCQISEDESLNIKIGQLILLAGKYIPWEEASNPGQFNTGKYYCSLGILGQFKKCKILTRGTKYSCFREGMWQIRQKAHEFLKQELGEDEGALVSAICLGEKSSLDEADKKLYQRSGISHILAISGLHFTLLGMGVFQILKMILGNNKGTLVTSIIIMSLYCVFTGNSISTIRAAIMFALSMFAKVLGRSYDSLSALGLAAILQLFMNPYVLNYSGFLLSFLAVIGVTFLAPRLQELLDIKGKLGKSLCISISSGLTTLPVLLCNYGTYPWYSVFLNLLILPVMPVLLFLAVVLVLMGMPTYFDGGQLFIMYSEIIQAENLMILDSIHGVNEVFDSGYGTNEILKVFWSIVLILKKGIVYGIKLILKFFEICCQIFEYIPFQDDYIGAPNVFQIMLYVCLIVIAISGLLNHSAFARKMILLSAVNLLAIQISFGAEVTMLDVGQGDSIVIRNSNGNIYISDCGSSSTSKIGKYRLIPFLKYKGYAKIKGIFVSHLDEDHMNGIVELLETASEENITISYLFLPKSILGMEEDKRIIRELEHLATQNRTKVVYLKQGDKIADGKMEFLCLYPKGSRNEEDIKDGAEMLDTGQDGQKKVGDLPQDRNNQSLVLLMQYKEFDMLLTGDVEKESEKEIISYIDRKGLWSGIRESNQLADELDDCDMSDNRERISVLKVAHHGSSGSSSEEFLKKVKPKLSLISCGKNNSYGHPHEETLGRLEDVESKILTTVDSGAIIIKIGKQIKVYEFKK